MNLITIARNIVTKKDFVLFVSELKDDFQKNPHEWENSTIDRYLEALSAWINDDDNMTETGGQIGDTPSWKTLGMILLVAKYYE